MILREFEGGSKGGPEKDHQGRCEDDRRTTIHTGPSSQYSKIHSVGDIVSERGRNEEMRQTSTSRRLKDLSRFSPAPEGNSRASLTVSFEVADVRASACTGGWSPCSRRGIKQRGHGKLLVRPRVADITVLSTKFLLVEFLARAYNKPLTVPHNRPQGLVLVGRFFVLPRRHTKPSNPSWNTLQSTQVFCGMLRAKQPVYNLPTRVYLHLL